jgi:nicotinate phosphoribosyltransferase
VGTHLDVSADAPALDMAYKLESYAGTARRKRSPGKTTWPGAKQVLRARGAHGEPLHDQVTLADEVAAGEALLVEVMRGGCRTLERPALGTLRERCRRELLALPADLRELAHADARYPVHISSGVRALAAKLDAAPV